MSGEVAGHGVAQSQGGEKEDQDRSEAGANVLRKIADGSANPSEIKTGGAGDDRNREIDASIPPMKDGETVADLRNELKRSGKHDDGSGGDMDGDRGITHGVAGNESAADEFVPGVVITAQCGKAVKGRDRKGENELAGDGHCKPEAGGGFQGGVRKGSHIHAVGQYGGAHYLFSLRAKREAGAESIRSGLESGAGGLRRKEIALPLPAQSTDPAR